MSRADLPDYAYHVRKDGSKPVIVIEDLNMGRMSVTNNIEAVVEAVCAAAQLFPNKAEIIYRDSEGEYDGVYEHGGTMHFYSLARRRITDENAAVAAALLDRSCE